WIGDFCFAAVEAKKLRVEVFGVFQYASATNVFAAAQYGRVHSGGPQLILIQIGDKAFTRFQLLPELSNIRCTRKTSAHSDDCDAVAPRRGSNRRGGRIPRTIEV